MSFKRFVSAVTFLAVVAMAARVSIDSDTFWHLAAGRWIWENGQILRVDPFSITRMGQQWVYPGWLAQLILFGIYETLGFAGLNLFTMAAVVLSFILLWTTMKERKLVRGFVVILAVASSGIFWSARPQMLTLVLASAFMVVLERHRGDEKMRGLWLLPFFMALWSNFHGGFIAGFLILLAFFVGELIEMSLAKIMTDQSWPYIWQSKRAYLGRLSLVGFLCVLAVSLNPFGPRMLLYPFQTISLETLSSYIQEWQSPNFHQPNTWPFLLMLFLTAVSMGFSSEKPRAHEILLFVGFGALALNAARNIGLFAVAGSLLLARHFSSAVKPLAEAVGSGRQVPARLSRTLNLVAFLLLFLALIVWSLPRIDEQASEDLIATQFPVEAVAVLNQQSPVGPIFHTYRWGGYLIWRGYPELQSFVDGRTDLFGDEVLDQYITAYRAEEDTMNILDQWGIQWVMVEPEAPLAATADRMGWNLVKSSSVALLFEVQ